MRTFSRWRCFKRFMARGLARRLSTTLPLRVALRVVWRTFELFSRKTPAAGALTINFPVPLRRLRITLPKRKLLGALTVIAWVCVAAADPLQYAVRPVNTSGTEQPSLSVTVRLGE